MTTQVECASDHSIHRTVYYGQDPQVKIDLGNRTQIKIKKNVFLKQNNKILSISYASCDEF